MKVRINKWYLSVIFLLVGGTFALLFYIGAFDKYTKPETIKFAPIVEIKVSVAIVFTGSGLGDKSYNDLVYDGVLQAQKELGIQFDYRELRKVAEFEKTIRELAKSGHYSLIIATGPEQEEAIRKVSQEYPNQKFTIIDSKLELANVSSLYTRWEEQAFVDGAMTALLMKEKGASLPYKAGVILGKDLPHLRQGALGFEAGMKYIQKKSDVLVAEVGSFSDPLRAKEISLLMYDQGVEYIQHLAGASGLGVFSAAKEVNKYAFGIDANQNFFQPDNIVATSERKINVMIFNEIKNFKGQQWKAGIHQYGMKEGIIKITREGSNIALSPQIIQEIDRIHNQIIQGILIVPKNELELKTWINDNEL